MWVQMTFCLFLEDAKCLLEPLKEAYLFLVGCQSFEGNENKILKHLGPQVFSKRWLSWLYILFFLPGTCNAQVTRKDGSGREELLNADGKFCCILHPLPHQERPVWTVGEDAFCSSTFHGASIPAKTHQGERSAQLPCWAPYCYIGASFSPNPFDFFKLVTA